MLKNNLILTQQNKKLNNKIKNMKKRKFKVGDKVIGNSIANKYTLTKTGFIGIVLANLSDGYIRIRDKQWPSDQIGFEVSESAFDLLSSESEISMEFVNKLYEECNQSGKKMLEEKYPNYFTSNIQKAVDSIGLCTGNGEKVIIYKDYILIPLPNANTEWTLAVFDYVKKFVRKYKNAYPIHGYRADKITNEYNKSLKITDCYYQIIYFNN